MSNQRTSENDIRTLILHRFNDDVLPKWGLRFIISPRMIKQKYAQMKAEDKKETKKIDIYI